jgi:hypothetical protein
MLTEFEQKLLHIEKLKASIERSKAFQIANLAKLLIALNKNSFDYEQHEQAIKSHAFIIAETVDNLLGIST